MIRLKPLVLLSFAAGLPCAYADDAAVMAVLRAGCTQDAQRLCAGVPPGGGRVLACLKQHKDELSDQCKQAAQKAAAMSGGSPPPAPSDSPTSTPPASDAAPAATPAAANPPAPQISSSNSPASATKHAAATHDTSGSYLRMKKVQVMLIMSTEANAQPKPELEMLIPATWDFKGGLVPWQNIETGCYADAYPLAMEAHSPDGTQSFYKIAEYSWQYSDDRQELQKLTDPNRRAHGGNGKVCEVAKPSTAEQYLHDKLMPKLQSGTQLISVEAYPELNEIVRQQMGLGPHDNPNGMKIDSIRAHVEFEAKGKAMEAWLTAAVVTRTFAVGRGSLYDMHAVDLMSLNAPKGQLAGNEKLLKVMMSSIHVMPDYIETTNKGIAHLYQIQAQKEAAIDKINADLQNFMTQTYMQMSANAAHVSDQGFLAADQGLRGVQTFRDPSTGRTMELSSQYDHAWLNGNNEYVMSDDPSFNPNAQLSGNWSQLQAVPPSP